MYARISGVFGNTLTKEFQELVSVAEQREPTNVRGLRGCIALGMVATLAFLNWRMGKG